MATGFWYSTWYKAYISVFFDTRIRVVHVWRGLRCDATSLLLFLTLSYGQRSINCTTSMLEERTKQDYKIMRISGRREIIDEDGATTDNWHHDDGGEVTPPLCQVEAFLDKWSSSPPLDRSEPVDVLCLYRLVITRPLIHRLLPFLRHNEQDEHMDHSAGTTTASRDTPVLKFNPIRFQCCCFWTEADTTMAYEDKNVCTLEDKYSFLSAIARHRGSLDIRRSREILSGLLSLTDIDHLEVQELYLLQHTPLPESEFVRLGALIQKSVQTIHLGLKVYLEDAPQEFYDCLANSIHIQVLNFGYLRDLYLGRELRPDSTLMSRLVVGEDGHGVVERLLRNPRSQLTSLALDKTYLEDHHLNAIAQLLPHSKVESILFNGNWIHLPGLLEFFRQIPKMHSLRRISCDWNPWQESIAPKASTEEATEEFGAALLECVKKSPSITYLGGIPYPLLRHHPLIFHYLSLNCGGRKILAYYQSQEQQQPTTSSPMPDGLWPHILAQAGRCDLHTSPERCYKHNGPANAVYFFLQHVAGENLFGSHFRQ